MRADVEASETDDEAEPWARRPYRSRWVRAVL